MTDDTKLTQYRIVIEGFSALDDIYMEEKLRKFLSLKGGKITHLAITGPRPKNITSMSLAIVWGYIENYLKEGDAVYPAPVGNVLGMAESTVKRLLKKLAEEPIGILRKSSRDRYFIKPRRELNLLGWLEDHPLWKGKWEPEFYTFNYPELSILMEKIPEVEMVAPPVKVPETMSSARHAYGFIENFAAVGDVYTTKEVYQTFGFSNQGNAHRLLTKLVERGLMEKVSPATWVRTDKAPEESHYRDEFLAWWEQTGGV